MNKRDEFPSPSEYKAPGGRRGLARSCIPITSLFQDRLRERGESRFWFCDAQHWPTPFKPFDTITVEFAIKCLGQYNTRHL